MQNLDRTVHNAVEVLYRPGRLAAILAIILFFIPQIQVLASNGPEAPFNDPTWKTLIGMAVLINGFLYILVCRRRTN